MDDRWLRLFLPPNGIVIPPTREGMEARIEELERMLVVARADVEREIQARKRAEADAYEHGLGDRAEVARQNRVLAASIAALVDRSSGLLVPR
jgi:hypothetical protein